MKLIADIREDQKRVKYFNDFFRETTVEVVPGTLPVCDYVVENDDKILFGIEFKTYSDFVSSMKNGHLVSQLMDMQEMENPYLFIVGDYFSWRKAAARKGLCNVTLSQMSGFQTSITARYKTKVFYFYSLKEAAEAIKHLIKIHMGLDHTQGKMPERKTRTENPNLDMYLALPGIGAKKAEQLLKLKFAEFARLCRYEPDAKKEIKLKTGATVSEATIDYIKALYP